MLDLERTKQALENLAAAPLHAKLRQAIHSQILDGTLRAGESLPSERVLQQHLGLSRATVRQALSSLIQAGLLQSVPGTSTFVREQPEIATQLGLVGLVVSSTNFHFFYPQLAAAFSARLRQSGYGLMMSLHNDRADTLARVVDELMAQQVIGLAITPPRAGNADAVVTQLAQRSIPTVFLGRRGISGQVDCIATDNEGVGYQATRHLIDLGHRRIVHLGFLDYSTGSDRAEGYQRAMHEAGLPPQIVELPISPEPASSNGTPTEHLADPAYQVARHLWHTDGHPRYTAAFCFNDVVAMGVYKAARDLSLQIPQDLSLVSVDNLPTVRHFEVPLTTFELPGEAIGRYSAERLLRRLGGDAGPPQTLLLPAQPILRASTVAPSGDD